jgi:hypothetical protein
MVICWLMNAVNISKQCSSESTIYVFCVKSQHNVFRCFYTWSIKCFINHWYHPA